jgi:hypothetical protein
VRDKNSQHTKTQIDMPEITSIVDDISVRYALNDILFAVHNARRQLTFSSLSSEEACMLTSMLVNMQQALDYCLQKDC